MDVLSPIERINAVSEANRAAIIQLTKQVADLQQALRFVAQVVDRILAREQERFHG